jgi:hypothetical protein
VHDRGDEHEDGQARLVNEIAHDRHGVSRVAIPP